MSARDRLRSSGSFSASCTMISVTPNSVTTGWSCSRKDSGVPARHCGRGQPVDLGRGVLLLLGEVGVHPVYSTAPPAANWLRYSSA